MPIPYHACLALPIHDRTRTRHGAPLRLLLYCLYRQVLTWSFPDVMVVSTYAVLVLVYAETFVRCREHTHLLAVFRCDTNGFNIFHFFLVCKKKLIRVFEKKQVSFKVTKYIWFPFLENLPFCGACPHVASTALSLCCPLIKVHTHTHCH